MVLLRYISTSIMAARGGGGKQADKRLLSWFRFNAAAAKPPLAAGAPRRLDSSYETSVAHLLLSPM